MNESVYISYSLQKIEDKVGWGDHAKWTDSNFKKLSQYIQDKSGISISSHTLKRLFGKINYKANYNPQEAIAKYLDFDSWDSLLNEIKENPDSGHKPVPSALSKLNFTRLLSKNNKFFIFPFLLVAVIALVLIVIKKWNSRPSFDFEIGNLIGPAPHTVKMNFDISKLKNKNIIVDLDHFNNNGNYLIQPLKSDIDKLSRCIHIPGKYNIKLFINKKLTLKKPVLVTTEDWVYYAIESNPSYNKIPDFIKPIITKRYFEINGLFYSQFNRKMILTQFACMLLIYCRIA